MDDDSVEKGAVMSRRIIIFLGLLFIFVASVSTSVLLRLI